MAVGLFNGSPLIDVVYQSYYFIALLTDGENRSIANFISKPKKIKQQHKGSHTYSSPEGNHKLTIVCLHSCAKQQIIMLVPQIELLSSKTGNCAAEVPHDPRLHVRL